MAIQTTFDWCCTGRCVNERRAKEAAPYLDIIFGALLIIAALGVNYGYYTARTSAMLLGAGICYVGLILYRLLVKCIKDGPLDIKVC